MKKYLSLITLLSLFLIQVHGFGHSESDHDNRDHYCVVCKLLSRQPGLVPMTIDTSFDSNLALIRVIPITENDLILKPFFSKSIGPRAPPSV